MKVNLEDDRQHNYLVFNVFHFIYYMFRTYYWVILGQFFMEPSDYYDAPIDKVLHFIRGVGLIKG
jgi:hypothetical protein